MNNRLQQFLAAENISQSVFADTIGVARASVSHILAGRNKPGFDFIESMSKHYPRINLEWLITGKGKMYKSEISDNVAVTAPVTPVEIVKNDAATMPEPQPEPEKIVANIKSNTSTKTIQTTKSQRNISKIIVLYDDGSYQELK